MFLAQSTTGTVQLASYLNEICGRLNASLARGAAIFDLQPVGRANSAAARADGR
jgi:hypothetical protein